MKQQAVSIRVYLVVIDICIVDCHMYPREPCRRRRSWSLEGKSAVLFGPGVIYIALRPRLVYMRVHDLGGKAPRDTYCQFTIRISTTTKYTLTNTLFFTLRERFVNCFLIGFSPSFTANPNTEINRIKRSDMITFYLSPSPLFECCNTPLMLLVSSCTAAAFLCAL